MTKALNNKNKRSSSPTVHIEVKEQIEMLFSTQRDFVVKLRSKSVRVNVKSASTSSALEWL